MKYILYETFINIIIILIFITIINFIKNNSNINYQKLINIEYILLIFFLSFSKAIYDYYKEKNK